MNVPKNVWSFEVLLYASLLLDALSLAFEDRTPRPGVTEQMITAQILFAAGMLVFVLYLIWLAARRRKGWPRWLLAVLVVLSLPQLAHVVAARQRSTRKSTSTSHSVSRLMSGCSWPD